MPAGRHADEEPGVTDRDLGRTREIDPHFPWHFSQIAHRSIERCAMGEHPSPDGA